MMALKDLFRMRTSGAGKHPAASPGSPLAVPAYYEVWGSLESVNRALWVALWFSLTVTLLTLTMLRILLVRPPVVIRVDGSGLALPLANATAPQAPGEAEVKNFLTLFERFFTELNCHTYESDLKFAFGMMTPEFQPKANDMLRRAGTLEALKANEGKTALTLTEIKIVRDTPQVMECHVKGYRELSSYKPDGTQSEVVFEDDVILRKAPRSETAPYGILVEEFSESLFKR
jgi:hypothetical protein